MHAAWHLCLGSYLTETHTGSRGDVFVVRTSIPVENLEKNRLFWSRYSFLTHSIYRKPRDWGLARSAYSIKYGKGGNKLGADFAIKRDTDWVERRYKATVISSLLRHSSVVPTVLPLASLAVRFATTGKPLHKRNLLKTSKTADMYNKCPVLKDLRFN